jgi:Kef-type K+ transport system membrane component KefB
MTGAAAANIAFTVVARGEFALILVALATQAGLDRRLAPFVAVYVLTLAVVSPILATHSAVFARLIPDRLLPTSVPGRSAAVAAGGGAPAEPVESVESESVEEVVPPW